MQMWGITQIFPTYFIKGSKMTKYTIAWLAFLVVSVYAQYQYTHDSIWYSIDVLSFGLACYIAGKTTK